MLKEIRKRLISVCTDTLEEVNRTQLLMVASGLAYTTILSVVPLLAVSFAVFKAFGNLDRLYEIIEPILIKNLAEGTNQEALAAIRGFIERIHAGALGASGLVMLIFTSMSMLASIEKAINKIWNVTTQKGFFQRITAYWFYISLGPLVAALVIGTARTHTTQVSAIWAVSADIVSFVLTLGFFFTIYKWIPARKVHWKSALWGAIFTTISWNVARFGYSIYTSQVVTYNKVYGSLGAVPIILLWIYIMWIIILAGAALSAALQRRFDLR